MKRCAHCGSEQDDAATVCQRCGKPLPGAAPAETVHLYDVLVESLDSDQAREQCAHTLLSLKRAPTLEGALEQLHTLPYVLFSHLTQDEANKYERLLKVSGVPAKLRASSITCPYCNFSAQLEGKSSERRDGVFYLCYSCHRKFFLSFRDHTSHVLLECSVCGAQLRLPVQARVGRYKCVCGTMIDYLGGGKVAPPPRAARPGRETVRAVHKAATTEPQFVGRGADIEERRRPWGLYVAVILAVAAVFILGLSLGSIRNAIRGRLGPSGTAAVELDPRIQNFTSATTREEIIGLLGPPRRESLSTDGVHRNLIYSDRGYYIVVGRESSGREVYHGTFRLTDEQPLHMAPPHPGAP